MPQTLFRRGFARCCNAGLCCADSTLCGAWARVDSNHQPTDYEGANGISLNIPQYPWITLDILGTRSLNIAVTPDYPLVPLLSSDSCQRGVTRPIKLRPRFPITFTLGNAKVGSHCDHPLPQASVTGGSIR